LGNTADGLQQVAAGKEVKNSAKHFGRHCAFGTEFDEIRANGL
jgi:hypothetical protein